MERILTLIQNSHSENIYIATFSNSQICPRHIQQQQTIWLSDLPYSVMHCVPHALCLHKKEPKDDNAISKRLVRVIGELCKQLHSGGNEVIKNDCPIKTLLMKWFLNRNGCSWAIGNLACSNMSGRLIRLHLKSPGVPLREENLRHYSS
ncbi:hypothetical protein CEXT_344041 [Caerostris extrusa]|uniref:Transposase n=1 Tax=Caerostris extrusa TaxID=172846 RepID=A0AAV4T043_CAEEX|nr:hypothetical protein CEXT_344041 [Caerostris extrusa]